MRFAHKSGLVWFRRDLRTQDNTALNAALAGCAEVHCVFVFDRAILDTLPRADRRVEFIRESLVELDASLREMANNPAAGLIVVHGFAEDEVPRLAADLGVQCVFAAHDYEPKAQARDDSVRSRLAAVGIQLATVKDHVIFEKREVLTQSATPYTVFTPYKRAWMGRLMETSAVQAGQAPDARPLQPRPTRYRKEVPPLAAIGFERTNLSSLRMPTGMSGAGALLADFWERIDDYENTRNFPAIKGPSYLSVHLRFGTVSIRELVRLALQCHLRGSAGGSTWLSELVWRDFYFQILANFPRVVTHAFKPDYDRIVWEQGDHAQALFDAWCQGRTGYPLVDAAMLQINQTGYMHNRLRMVAGSFLVKHLGIDWRLGEKYFADNLLDYDLAANNGGWQWVSSSGCDAQPYFRIFNPVTQSEKFDAQGRFIKRYLPQLAMLDAKDIHAPWAIPASRSKGAARAPGCDYPLPIVDHATARARTLLRYAVVKMDKLSSIR